mmetsp:Transcript_11787/g.27100  ORF Transcript_11787/g.27100 Transcript_11787/m.27100 type:complete len:80 (+) Transcript_11787:93-332(+)
MEEKERDKGIKLQRPSMVLGHRSHVRDTTELSDPRRVAKKGVLFSSRNLSSKSMSKDSLSDWRLLFLAIQSLSRYLDVP